MTDPSPLTPEQEAVRRLLADARHDGPTPPDVVARLDETLASLVSERAAPPQAVAATAAPVVNLGARRRRRAGIGLLAAAAVVVAGVAIGQGLPRTSGSDAGSSSSAADSAGPSTSESGEDDGGADAEGSTSEMAPEARKNSSPAPLAGLPTLSTTDAALGGMLVDVRDDDTGSVALDAVEAQLGCELSGIGRGRRVVARVDGQLGLVVFRRPAGGEQKADLYVCGLSLPVRTVTLPAR